MPGLMVVPSGGLDQPRRVPTMKTVLQQVDRGIAEAAKLGDSSLAFNVLEAMADAQAIGALGQCKTLWLMTHKWDKIAPGEGGLEELIFVRMGWERDTVRRYIGVWDMIRTFEIGKVPESIVELVQARPISDLIAMYQWQNEHGRLTLDQLKQVAQAEDSSTMRGLLRKFRGAPEYSGYGYKLRKDGSFEVWENGVMEVLGFLRVSEADMENPLRKKAMNRILKRLGVQVE